MQTKQFSTIQNNLGICEITLAQYNENIIFQLKHFGFKFWFKTKAWSKTGFKNLNDFDNYILAILNNDLKAIKKLEPKKDDIIKQCITLKRIGAKSKKAYIDARNEQKINELQKTFDSGVANILLQYCIKNKLNFWDITENQVIDLISKDNELLNDIIDFNKLNDIVTCDAVIDIIEKALPF